MRAARYHLVTQIAVGAGQERVWEALADVSSWPSWWRWLRSVRIIDDGDEQGLGGSFASVVATPLRYRLRYVTTIVGLSPHRWVELLSDGDLRGRGRFDLAPAARGGTDVTFTWLVETPKWWMSLLAPVARPLFVWNHDRLMHDFGEGLALGTGSRLWGVRSRVLSRRHEGFFRLPGADDAQEPDAV